MLVYSINTHNISETGDVDVESKEHRECVLFKSGAPTVTPEVTATPPVVKETPKQLPKTGPENYIIMMLFALIFGFAITKMRRKSSI
jgi:LPXTG-motif cell wall-anchored protein